MRTLGVAAWALCLGGCFSAHEVECGDQICPPNYECAAGGGCVLPEQLTVCDGLPDGTSCRYTGVAGQCEGGVCEPVGCGDGVIQSPEQCEPTDLGGLTCESLGFQAGTLACTDHCTLDYSACSGYCGDGIKNGDEQCDPGDAQHPTMDLGGADCTTLGFYQSAGLACNAICRFDTTVCKGFCGDGITNGNELCDGTPPSGLSCLDFGYDAGEVGCRFCAPAPDACAHFGWQPITTPTTSDLNDVWASGVHDIYAVGAAGTLVHDDGASVGTISLGVTQNLLAVTGSSANDVFVGGQAGILQHWNGSAWMSMNSTFGTSDVEDLFALSATDVYAVGAAGKIAHYNGTTWTAMTSGTANELRGVWARGVNDVWAVGAGATIIHYNGTAWSPAASTGLPSSYIFDAVATTATSDVWVTYEVNGAYGSIVSRTNGASWNIYPEAVGERFKITSSHNTLVADGMETLNALEVGWLNMSPAGSKTQYGVGSDPAGHLWSAGQAGTLLSYTGTSWSNLLAGSGNMTAIWGIDSTHVFGVEFVNCFMEPGSSAWGDLGIGCSVGHALLAVWGTSATNVYAAGMTGGMIHYDGTSWTTMTSGTTSTLSGLWGSGAGDIYAVAAAGTVLHSTGTTWAPVSIPATSENLNAIWGSAANSIFVVGAAGRLLHYDGTWTSTTIGTGSDLDAIWGSSASDVWAAGAAGTLLHFDGATWTTVASGTTLALRSLWGTGPNDIFAGGDLNALLHYDGTKWTPIHNPDTSGTSISSIWGDGRHIYLGGTLYVLDRFAFPGTCAAKETSCNDGYDDDCDFLVDCADPDCTGAPGC